jgi:two-component system KDP operon response regulator KdpE
MDGIEACRELRRVRARIPILMITVHDAEDMVVRALEAGADDYLTKPFRTGELAARLRALIRRSRANDTRSGGVIRVADIQLDAARRTVLKAGTPVRLTPKEFDLLAYLMMNAGFPIPHARLLFAVWGPEYGQEVEYLRTFIRQLRIKLEDNPAEPQYLQTVSHLGYRFREPVEDSASVC